MNSRIFEAQRLLRRASEINPEATAMVVKAMQQLAEAYIIPKHAMFCINEALPGAALTEKERGFLCPKSSTLPTADYPGAMATPSELSNSM